MSFDYANIVSTVVLFFSGWVFNKISTLSEKYVLKTDYQKDQDKIDSKLDKIQDSIDDIKERLN